MQRTINMILEEKLSRFRIILGSGSPRRQQLLRDMGIPFEIRIRAVEESYPDHLSGEEIAVFLAEKKARSLQRELREDELLITADTVVWHRGASLEKPRNKSEATKMLKTLSGDSHQVITAVCLTTNIGARVISDNTRVRFARLSDQEIAYYIENYKPFDKAGGYGIQEWLGLIAIEEIAGSYTNVVGLPTRLVYKALMEMAGQAAR